jgi:oxygen-independent coproporphyrinogen-3 oxidase
MAGIYIHIPFCKQACYYCDFHFSTNQQQRTELVKAISSELILQKKYLKGEPVETIYFGGGTPSLLHPDELQSILKTIQDNFQLIDFLEITLEANPDDLDKTKLEWLFKSGINRLSIGIQSFQNKILKFLNRAHDATAAIECMALARAAGFTNISIDLIYAIPSQDEEMWIRDIRQAIALVPEHISCYSLTIEEKTVFGKWSVSGKFKSTTDEVAARHLEVLMEELEGAGYEHYEISNFSRPGFQSKHNSSYWKQSLYLGVGPSAHSYNGESRQFNINNNSLYVKALDRGEIPFEKEILTTEDKVNEYILTSLRTQWGTNLEELYSLYKYDLVKEHQAYLTTLFEKGLAVMDTDVLKLTRKGKFLADKISSDLFLLPA